MAMPLTTKTKIMRALDDLPPESLSTVVEFIEFLRSKAASPAPRRLVRLGGLWQGYTFSEEDIRAARYEAWAGLGRGLGA
ncbi:MAG: hypothetical protein ACRDH2_00590 [Anaerolineales bacterium]